MDLEADATHYVFIYVDEAGFNLAKVRRRGRNIIGHRATVTMPGQRGANITICAAISTNGVLCHIPSIGPYNSDRLMTFLNALHDRQDERGLMLMRQDERGLFRANMSRFVTIWDNVAFHHS